MLAHRLIRVHHMLFFKQNRDPDRVDYSIYVLYSSIQQCNSLAWDNNNLNNNDKRKIISKILLYHSVQMQHYVLLSKVCCRKLSKNILSTFAPIKNGRCSQKIYQIIKKLTHVSKIGHCFTLSWPIYRSSSYVFSYYHSQTVSSDYSTNFVFAFLLLLCEHDPKILSCKQDNILNIIKI